MKKTKGMLTWIINDNCNYRCKYCFSDKNSSYYIKEYDRFIENIKRYIPEFWNINFISGGEPFMHPGFCDIVKKLVANNYYISVTSNLSISIDQLKYFFSVSRGSLLLFVASLHLDYDGPGNFIKKINAIRKIFPEFREWLVVTVALPDKLEKIKEMKNLFRKEKINFQALPYRLKNFKYYKYTRKQLEIIKNINNIDISQETIDTWLRTKGSKCACGKKAIVINPFGEVYRCMPAMRNKNKMGNINKEGIRLHEKEEACNEEQCSCFEKFLYRDLILNFK